MDQEPLSKPKLEEVITHITAAQRPLSAYIRTLVAPWGSPEDVLQEVNLVLWRKAAEFDGRGEFLTWACRIAFLQVLAYRKKIARDRFVPFDESVLSDLAGPLDECVKATDPRISAMRSCLDRLSSEARRLVALRYAEGGSVGAAAVEAGRTAESVRVTLHRVRRSLLQCIEKKLLEGIV